MKTLKELRREVDISPLHLILLTNTGSMTTILEALFGDIGIETETQAIIKADTQTANILKIKEGESVNYRVVQIVGRTPLVHATSYAPLSRLKEGFREDLIKKDTPIGKILSRHKVESRREFLGVETARADERFADIFGISENTLLLKRNYNIIHEGKPLMNISEVFPYDIVEWSI